MKTNFPNESDETLRKLMQDWKVTVSLPPRFPEQVWGRIERAESQPRTTLWTAFLDWLDTALPRPAMATSYVLVLLVAGMATGYWQGQEKATRTERQIETRYVQMVDPYQRVTGHK